MTLSVCERKTGEKKCLKVLVFFLLSGAIYSKKRKKEKKAHLSSLSSSLSPSPPPTTTPNNQGGLSAGGGISAQGAADGALPGFIGSASFSQRNLFGLGQKLAATLEVGQIDKLFRLNHSDPWILGDPHRTARVASLQNTRSSGAPIYGAVTLEEEEFFGGNGGIGLAGGGGGGSGNNNNDPYLSPSSSFSYFPADSNAGALDPSGQYAGSPPRSTAAVAAANAADAESPIIISRLTGEWERRRRRRECYVFFSSSKSRVFVFLRREKKKLTLFSLLSLLSLSLSFLHLTKQGGVEYSRPLSVGWTGTLGFGWQRASAVDEKGRTLSTDAYGAPLTHAGGGRRRHAGDGAAAGELRRGAGGGAAVAGAGAAAEALVAQLQQGPRQGGEEGEPGGAGHAVAAARRRRLAEVREKRE